MTELDTAPVPDPDMPIHRVFALGWRATLADLEQAEATVAWLHTGYELSHALAEDAYNHIARLRHRILYRNATI